MAKNLVFHNWIGICGLCERPLAYREGRLHAVIWLVN